MRLETSENNIQALVENDKSPNEIYRPQNAAEETSIEIEQPKKEVKSPKTKDCRICLRAKLVSLKIDNGLTKIMESESYSLAFFWGFIYVSFWAFVIYGSVLICLSFYVYQTVTDTTIEKEDQLAFPTVTFCDNNVLGFLDINETFKKQYSDEYDSQIRNDPNLTLNDKMISLYYFEISKRYIFLRELENNFNNKKVFKENIITCAYNGQKCEDIYKDFEVTFDNGLGICYHYNSISSDAKIATKAGDHNGLRIVYFQPIKNSAVPSVYGSGIKVFIQDRSIDDLTYDGGFTLEVGDTKFVIGIEKVVTSLLSSPYGSCVESAIDGKSFPFYAKTLNLFNFYTQNRCLNVKIQDAINKECQCFLATFPQISNHSPCFSPSELTCSQSVYERISNDLTQYDACPLECSIIEYPLSMSFSKMDANLPKLLYENSKFKNGTNISTFKEQVLDFAVHYSTLLTKRTVQSAKMDGYQVLSGIGGYLGLFLGISFLNFAELIEVLIKHFFFSKKVNNK